MRLEIPASPHTAIESLGLTTLALELELTPAIGDLEIDYP